MIVELKYDKSAEGALEQIKKKQFCKIRQMNKTYKAHECKKFMCFSLISHNHSEYREWRYKSHFICIVLFFIFFIAKYQNI